MATVFGLDLDPQTRCCHYCTSLDIVAIKMNCCGRYYACRQCHDELAGHDATVWPRAEFDQPAILCGACQTEMTIAAYLASGHQCPNCAAPFNPGCQTHYHLYFEMEPEKPQPSGNP